MEEDYYTALQEDIADAKEEVKQAAARLEVAQRWLADLECQVPPFKEAQEVRVLGSGGVLVVLGCERAFGEWVVKGYFASNKHKSYYYPTTMLMAMPDDDEDVPF